MAVALGSDIRRHTVAGFCHGRPAIQAEPGTCVGFLEFHRLRPDNRFMQMVRRRVLAIAFSLALLALVSSGAGRSCSDRTDSGGRCDHERGLCRKERCSAAGTTATRITGWYCGIGRLTRDAIDVTVEVEAVDGRGQSIADSYTTVTLIPAGADFVISGALIWRGSPELAGIETEVHKSDKPRRGVEDCRQSSMYR